MCLIGDMIVMAVLALFFVWNPEKYRPFPYGRLGKAVGKERDAFYIGKLEQ